MLQTNNVIAKYSTDKLYAKSCRRLFAPFNFVGTKLKCSFFTVDFSN